MIYEGVDRWNSPYLIHYGVKGMKWGVRHDYIPKGRRNHGSKIYKNKAFKYKGNTISIEYDGSDFVVDSEGSDIIMKSLKESQSVRSKHKVNRKEYRKEKVNNILAGTTVAVGIAAAIPTLGLSIYPTLIAGSNLYTDLKAQKEEKRYFEDRKKNSKLDKETGLYKKTTDMTIKQDMAKVNPGFNRYNENYKSNCGLCSVTYDMRRRGYDVTAKPDMEGRTDGDIKAYYPSSKIVIPDERNYKNSYSSKLSREKMLGDLSRQPNSRGYMSIKWIYGGGHALGYEVDKKGKVSIIDSQSNTKYDDPESVLRYGFAYTYSRLDNVKPNIKLIKEECVR